MKNMTLEAMAAACGGRLVCPEGCPADKSREAAGIVIDSRQIEPGFVFVALKGEKVDGHRFIPDVFAKGAMAAVCTQLPAEQAGPCILVEDSYKALRDLASYYRSQLDIRVIGITGSVGKTSTKEFIASVLEQKYRVLKTEGNFNNDVGLPLTIFKIRQEHQAAVLEMGISDFGEMHVLSSIARPDICVITNIGVCHMEFLHDRDGVLRAKSEIFDFMNPEGAVVLNGDDDKLQTIHRVGDISPATYGFGRDCDLWADQVDDLGLAGCEAVFHDQEGEYPVRLNLPGRHMILNALAAAAVGRIMGVSTQQIRQGIAAVRPVSGRSHLIRLGGRTLIDDCYNANPVSVKAALDLLKSSGTRTVAVLGDMLELGTDEKEMHADVGRYCAQKEIDCLLCVGALSRYTYEAAKAAGGSAWYFESLEGLMTDLPFFIQDRDTILVKASHSMGFSALVKELEDRFAEQS